MSFVGNTCFEAHVSPEFIFTQLLNVLSVPM